VPIEVKFGITSLCVAIPSYYLGKSRRRLEDKIVTDIIGLISVWNGRGPSAQCHVIKFGFCELWIVTYLACQRQNLWMCVI